MINAGQLVGQNTQNTTRAATAITIRYRIVGLLAGFSLVAYILRMNISVAAKFMMPDLGLTQIQMGQVFSAFMLGYALFQVPWGILGDRSGPRRMLTAAALVWVAATALTGFAPGMAIPGGAAAFVTLLILRFALGAGQAALYPLAARTVGNWMRASERAFAYSLIIAAAAAGSAFTGPLVAWSMVALGWRASFYLCSILALAIAALWYRYATDQPESHPAIGAAELAVIQRERPAGSTGRPSTAWFTLLRNPNISLICASYFLSSYVLFMFIFWLYLYLVEERKFSVLSGGFFTSMPYILALIVVPLGGYVSDRAGRRLVAIAGFAIAAVRAVHRDARSPPVCSHRRFIGERRISDGHRRTVLVGRHRRRGTARGRGRRNHEYGRQSGRRGVHRTGSGFREILWLGRRVGIRLRAGDCRRADLAADPCRPEKRLRRPLMKRRQFLRRTAAVAGAAPFIAAARRTRRPPVCETLPKLGPKQVVKDKSAVCSSSHPLVTQTMIDVLRGGGNAVDAATAGALMSATVEPHMTITAAASSCCIGIPAPGKPYQLPATGRWFRDCLRFVPLPAGLGGFSAPPGRPSMAACIPGFIPGLAAAHGRFGSKPWAELCGRRFTGPTKAIPYRPSNLRS